jgi:hypothetical protein
MRVASVIRGETVLPARGTKGTPVWDPLFWNLSQGHPGEVQQRVASLNDYLESLQAK